MSWNDFAAREPELAELVLGCFGVREHATMATLRSDGAPRISGTEVEFGDSVRLGSMPGSVKALDLRRDPRAALHSPTVDPPRDDPSAWAGEAKLSGRAVEVADNMFAIELTEVVHTRVGTPADHLRITSWHPERGTEVRLRY